MASVSGGRRMVRQQPDRGSSSEARESRPAGELLWRKSPVAAVARALATAVVLWVLAVVGAAVATAELPESEPEAFRDERGGLVALRNGLRSAKDLHSNWTGRPCHGRRSRWYGVSCDGDGVVVGLELQDNLLNRAGVRAGRAHRLQRVVQLPLGEVPASAFGHNLKLCGDAVNAACRSGPPSPGSRDGPVVRPDEDAGGLPARQSRRFRLAAWSVLAIALIAAMVPFAAVLIFLHQNKKSREVRLDGRATSAGGAAHIKAKAEQGKESGSGSGGQNAQAQLQFFRADKAAGFF